VPTVVEIMQLMNAKKSRREGREKAIAKRKSLPRKDRRGHMDLYSNMGLPCWRV
jgi:hypothetical protein